ncbi:MAG: CPBP family intramembrane glutamic endopeptidase [Acidobacteriota bacterium]
MSLLRPARGWLWAEWVVIWIGFPIGLYVIRQSFGRWIVPTLLVTGSLCAVILWRDPSFDRARFGLGGTGGGWQQAASRMLRTFVPLALGVALATWIWLPDRLFEFPRSNTRFWLIVMVLYPLLSVYPQELIFRTFFFHRYRPIFPSDAALCLSSAVVFGLAHVFFANWLAPVMTTLGGWLFARTYARTGSTVLTSVEHGLWGDYLFTLGLGFFFWGGSIRFTLESIG